MRYPQQLYSNLIIQASLLSGLAWNSFSLINSWHSAETSFLMWAATGCWLWLWHIEVMGVMLDQRRDEFFIGGLFACVARCRASGPDWLRSSCMPAWWDAITATICSRANRCFVTCGCPHSLVSQGEAVMDVLVMGVVQGHPQIHVIHVSALHSICTPSSSRKESILVASGSSCTCPSCPLMSARATRTTQRTFGNVHVTLFDGKPMHAHTHTHNHARRRFAACVLTDSTSRDILNPFL